MYTSGYWCSPYHEWQHIYSYFSDVQSKWGLSFKDYNGSILGSETLAWSEMIDSVNIEQKIWPRSAALAEVLWGRTEVTTFDLILKLLV